MVDPGEDPVEPDPSDASEFMVFGFDLTNLFPSPESIAYRVIRFIFEHVLKIGRGFFRAIDAFIRSVGISLLTVVGVFVAFELVGFGVWALGNALMCGAEAGKDQSNPIMALLQIIVLGVPGAALRIIGFLMLLPTIMIELALDISIVSGTLDSMACT